MPLSLARGLDHLRQLKLVWKDITPGAWNKVLYTYVPNTAAAGEDPNGKFTWYLNDQLIGEYAGIDYPATAAVETFQLGIITTPGAADVIVDDLGIIGFPSSGNAKLLVRGSRGRNPVNVNCAVIARGIDKLHFERLYFDASGFDVIFRDCPSLKLASSIFKAKVQLNRCDDAAILGCTFDHQSFGDGLKVISSNGSQGVRIKNSLFLNPGTVSWTNTASTVVNDYNCHSHNAPTGMGANSVVGASNVLAEEPNATPDRYFANNPASRIVAAGVALADMPTDIYGNLRHATTPTIGACEFINEVISLDVSGRVTARTIGGRTYRYTYDGQGRLLTYTDPDPAKSAVYEYDHLGRRILMTIGVIPNHTRYRFVYDGADLVAEYVDTPEIGGLDRVRYYWKLPGMDRRLGFVDEVGTTRKAYFYLYDQVGSVWGVIDEHGTLVNRYAYDAFGNFLPEHCYETVENRYCFQGREFDKHRGDYFFRMRCYVPEWGAFTGPDMKVDINDFYGQGSFVAFGNNLYNDNYSLTRTTITS